MTAPATTAPATTAPATTVPATTAPATTEPAPVGFADQWERVEAPPECMCGDGSPWSFFVRQADPAKVLFFLEGGGACFNAEMCAPGSTSYKQSIGYEDGFDASDGIFDLDNPQNPFADYSIVFVPYCTGDVHSGNTTTDYGEGVVIEHKGQVNGTAALDELVARFPDATRIVVGGASAGSFPTPFYAGMVADLLPAADVKVIADGSGAIPDAMGLVVSNWGTIEALPDWPEVGDITPAEFTPSYIFEVTAAHDPSIDFARHDYAFDEVLAGYAELVGLDAGDLVSVMTANEIKVEATGATVATWIAPGDDHTVVGASDFYTEQLNGVRFVDWLEAFLDDAPLPDQRCEVCTA
jgi:Pectinacetylesterase